MVPVSMTLSNLAKYSVTQSIAQSLCDSWASCCSNRRGLTYNVRLNLLVTETVNLGSSLNSLYIPSICNVAAVSITQWTDERSLILPGLELLWHFRKYQNRKCQKYRDILYIFYIFDIFQKMKISNKLYNNGCNTLMQYLMTISYQSLVPYIKM